MELGAGTPSPSEVAPGYEQAFGPPGGPQPQITAYETAPTGPRDPERTLDLRADNMLSMLEQGVLPSFIPFEIQARLGLTDEQLSRRYRRTANGWVRIEYGPAQVSAGGASYPTGGGGITYRIVAGGNGSASRGNVGGYGLVNWRV